MRSAKNLGQFQLRFIAKFVVPYHSVQSSSLSITLKEESMAIDLKSLNYTQLTELINRAEQRKVEATKEHLASVREKVLALLHSDGLTLEDVFGGRYKAPRAPRKPRDAAAPTRARRKRGNGSK